MIMLDIDGVTRSLVDWCRMSGVSYHTAWSRIKNGWPAKDAVYGRPRRAPAVSAVKRGITASVASRYYRMLFEDINACAYCGCLPETIDHVTPLSYARSMSPGELERANLFCVRCCGECNSLGSDYVFDSFADKFNHIKSRMKARYANELRVANWTREELSELSGFTEQDVKNAVLAKRAIEMRLSFDPGVP